MFRRKESGKDVVHRWEGNPLIELANLDFTCADMWSAGVACYKNEIILLVTIEHLAGYQAIHLAKTDEKDRFYVDEKPFIGPCRDDRVCGPHESHGVMDARVTCIDGTYYIMYLANGQHGFRLGLVETHDFVKINSQRLISEPDMKAGALFPKKINGMYARLERPTMGNSIWISFSNDLIYWGKSAVLMTPRPGFWDWNRIGAGPPPIRIHEAWLLIYYGIKETTSGSLMRLGAAILEDKNPGKIIYRSNIPILSPRENYERIGNLNNQIFSTGAFIKNGNTIHVVYSGADSCICMGSTTIDEIVETCARSKEDF